MCWIAFCVSFVFGLLVVFCNSFRCVIYVSCQIFLMLIIVLKSLSLWIRISVLLVAWNFDPRSCEVALGLWSLLQFGLALYSLLVEGCDPSVLLDATDGIDSENESLPKESLRGFVDLIDVIKSELEEACPGVVSCADVVVFAARESVLLAGGPLHPLQSGRRDSIVSFSEVATYKLPSPQNDLYQTITSFASKGFNEREIFS